MNPKEAHDVEIVHENSRGDLTVRADQSPMLRAEMELSVEQVLDRTKKVQAVMKAVMKPGIHYGVIPGTEKKDTEGKDISKMVLLKPGAEILCMTFRLAPKYINERFYEGGHLTIYSTCELSHQVSGQFVAAGGGECSTKESKYAYRQGKRTCPNCNVAAVIKGKEEFGGGWLCWKKNGGCGSKWQDGDKAIEGQDIGRIANPDVPDQYNTVLKMAQKRAKVDATISALACSDIFTQDIGDDLEVDDTPAKSAGTANAGGETKQGGAQNAGGGSGAAEDGKKAQTKPKAAKNASGKIGEGAKTKVLEGLFNQLKFPTEEAKTSYRALMFKQFSISDTGFPGMTEPQYETCCRILKKKVQDQGTKAVEPEPEPEEA